MRPRAVTDPALASAKETLTQLAVPATDPLIQGLTYSKFVRDQLASHLPWLLNDVDIVAEAVDVSAIREELRALVEAGSPLEATKQSLRRLRNRVQMHLIIRHINGAPLEETATAASAIADAFIQTALDWATAHLLAQGRFGRPLDEHGNVQRLVVFAFGKLGANELNLSSDIDLVLAYPQSGQTDTSLTNQQYFVRLAQLIVDLLHAQTVDGFVYRVDLRLRPYGDSGPLVMHFDALETYYETQGRDWERYALIKTRVCAGDSSAGEVMLDRLRPFVYRRYLDFGAIQALREMKARLVRERRDPHDIKLGPGGIRDVEFGVQALQMVWGGRQTELQTRALLEVIDHLVDRGHVAETTRLRLVGAYRFLRDVEHSLQAYEDKQTQTLPGSPELQQNLANVMGYEDYASFLRVLDGHRQWVEAFFADAVAPVESEGPDVWHDGAAITSAALASLGIDDPEPLVEPLNTLHAAAQRSSVGEEARLRLSSLMNVLLPELVGIARPLTTVQRLVPILRAVLRRSSYLSLLIENPQARRALLDLIGRSQWLAEQVREQPVHLDSLLDDRIIPATPDRASLDEDLTARLKAAKDDEEVLERLRVFRHEHALAVAVAELKDKLTLMQASDYYTYLAEVLLEAAVRHAWQANDGPEEMPFVVVGYGKLGGYELGPSSDLDLVFVHDLTGDYSQFLHRFARTLLTTLTARTYHGVLYEIDMRLRPSGNAGTMVSSLEAFVKYQDSQAWTWEQQALVRARPVAGDRALARRFVERRHTSLTRERDPRQLVGEVTAMRSRMSAHLGHEADLKQAAGGIVDIEFMVQYLVLAHAFAHPELTRYTDNVRILQTSAEVGVIDEQVAEQLIHAYVALRMQSHRTALDIPDPESAKRLLEEHRSAVRGAWATMFGEEE